MRFSRYLIFAVLVLMALLGLGISSGMHDEVSARTQRLPPAQEAVIQIAAFFLQDGQIKSTKTGSGIVIGPWGLILTNAHVIRHTSAGCGQSIDPSSQMAEILVVLITEDPTKPPEPKFVATPLRYPEAPGKIVEDLRLDLVLLQVDKKFKGRDIDDLHDLKRALADLTPEDFEARFTAELQETLDLATLLLGDSEVLSPAILTTVSGYPVISEVPQITVTEGPIAQAPFEEDFFLINRAFATFGNSGGAVIDRDTNFLVGVLCGGQFFPGAGETLAKAVLINKAKELIDPEGRGLELPPVARWRFDPQFPQLGQTVTFVASSSFDPDATPDAPDRGIVSFTWDFDARVDIDGDGDPTNDIEAEGIRTTHIFDTPGVKRVVLWVSDADGLATSKTQSVLIRVSRGIPGQVIQDQLDAANPRDIVLIEPGDYLIKGSLFINKPLTLKGAGREVVSLFGNGQHPVIAVQNTENVVIEGITISTGHPGLLIEGSRAVKIINTVVRDNLRRGIFVRSSEVEILQNEIMDNGLDTNGTQGQGIQLQDSPRVTIAQNTISGNDDAGISLRNSTSEIRENMIHGNRNKGISMEAGSTATLAENMILGNRVFGVLINQAEAEIQGGTVGYTRTDFNGYFGDGIVVEEGSSASISDGSIEGNARKGITVSDATAEINKGTSISFNTLGLFVEGLAQVSLTDSTVHGNSDGLKVGDSAQVTLTHSQVFDNEDTGLGVGGSAAVAVQNSQISDNDIGLDVGDSARVTLQNSRVFDNRFGLWVWGQGAMVSLTDSHVSDNDIGLDVMGVATVTLTDCQVSANREYGIDITEPAKAIISSSRIENNGKCGVYGDFIFGWGNHFSGNGQDACDTDARRLSRTLPSNPHSQPRVAVPQDTPTIQRAIDLVAEGGTITVAPGTYNETLEILNLGFDLNGAGRDQVVLTSEERGSAIIHFSETTKEVRLEGLTIGPSSGNGLSVGGSAKISLTNSKVVGNGYNGLFVTDSATVVLTDCQVSSNADGVFILLMPIETPRSLVTVSLIDSIISDSCEGLWVLEHPAGATVRAMVSLTDSIISGNWCEGLFVLGPAHISLANSQIFGNRNGLAVVGRAVTVNMQGSNIFNNGRDGIILGHSTQATINGSMIINNNGYGVALYLKSCFDSEFAAETFAGHVLGRGNIIPGPGEPDGNGKGAVCPPELEFLMTEEGGEYP